MTTNLTAPAPPTVDAPGRLAVDSAAPCAAPDCGLALDKHPAGSRPFHVDGRPVGSDECAARLYSALHPAAVTVRHKPCGCGVLAGERCDCDQVAAGLAAAPVFRLAVGGAR